MPDDENQGHVARRPRLRSSLAGFNKATSLAAVFFVASSYLIGKVIRWHDHDKALRLVVIKFCGLMGFFLAGIHALFSLSLLSPAYYAKYFDPDDRLNLDSWRCAPDNRNGTPTVPTTPASSTDGVRSW